MSKLLRVLTSGQRIKHSLTLRTFAGEGCPRPRLLNILISNNNYICTIQISLSLWFRSHHKCLIKDKVHVNSEYADVTPPSVPIKGHCIVESQLQYLPLLYCTIQLSLSSYTDIIQQRLSSHQFFILIYNHIVFVFLSWQCTQL